MYLWSEIDGVAYGIKADLSKNSDGVLDDKKPIPFDADVRYDCKPWANVDNTVFVPQGDVLFQDIDEMMQSGMEYGTVYEE